jgi:hypothetical protein
MKGRGKGIGFFGRRFEDAYGRDNAVWASVAIYLTIFLLLHAGMERYNPIAPRPSGRNIVIIAVFFAVALLGAGAVAYSVIKLVFDPGSGVSPRAAAVFCHALFAGIAYMAWGLVDRCVRSDAPRTGADGKDLCGGESVCKASVHSALIPLAALACDIVFFGVALAGAVAAGAAFPPALVPSIDPSIEPGTEFPAGFDPTGRDVVGSILSYAKIALFARGVLEICKLVFDYEATLVASLEDVALQEDLVACHTRGARKFGTCPDSGADAAGPGAAAGPGGGIPAPRTGLVSLTVFRLGVRRTLLETAGFITAFAVIAFVYNLVPGAATAAEKMTS